MQYSNRRRGNPHAKAAKNEVAEKKDPRAKKPRMKSKRKNILAQRRKDAKNGQISLTQRARLCSNLPIGEGITHS